MFILGKKNGNERKICRGKKIREREREGKLVIIRTGNEGNEGREKKIMFLISI